MTFKLSTFALTTMALSVSVLLSAPAHAAPDAALLRAAQAAQPAVIVSLKDMVALESGTMDAPGLTRMADYVQARLQALGGQVERRKASSGNGDILIARHSGTGKRKFMLIAHMDTIYAPGTLQTQPIKQDGNRLYGPGIADDKGGIAVVLHTLQILKAAGWKDYAQLTVVFNGDEESSSNGSGATIAALAAEHEVVLSYEPTAAKAVAKVEGVLLSAAGTGTATLTVQGRSSHAGAAPDEGRNALIEMAHQVLQTADIAKTIPGAQLNWTQAESGKVRNQIPDQASASADVRLTATDAAAKLQAALDEKAKAHRVNETRVSYVVQTGRPPYVGDARTRELAAKAQAIYAELDGRPLYLHPSTGAGTDAGYASMSGKAAVLESMGLAGWGYHARDEYIEIDSIVPRLYLSARLLMQLAQEAP